MRGWTVRINSRKLRQCRFRSRGNLGTDTFLVAEGSPSADPSGSLPPRYGPVGDRLSRNPPGGKDDDRRPRCGGRLFPVPTAPRCPARVAAAIGSQDQDALTGALIPATVTRQTENLLVAARQPTLPRPWRCGLVWTRAGQRGGCLRKRSATPCYHNPR